MSFDESELDAGIPALEAKIASIRDARVKVGFDQATADAELAELQAKLDALSAKSDAGIDEDEFDAEYAEIKAKLDALAADQVNIRVGISGAPEATAQLAGLSAVMKAISDNSEGLIAALTGIGNSEREVGGESDSTSSKLRDVGSAVTAAGEAASHSSGWWGMLTKEVTLFGGALGDIHMVGQIPLWHILLDAVLETTIGFTEAAIALGVFAAAAAPAAEDIYTHIKSVDDVVHALGVDIAPVTGHFHELQEAMAPQVLELYGGALNLLGKSGDSLDDVVERLVTGFDDWIAKLDMFMDAQSHTDGIVSAGADVLSQMADILDNLGIAFENLMKADPGTVHFLLDVVEGGTKLIEIFTEIPTPILYSALAIHSFLLWGGLLTTGVVKMLTPLYSLSTALGGVGKEASAVGQLGEEASGLDRLKAVVADIGAGFSGYGSKVATAATETEGFERVSATADAALGGLLGKLDAIGSSPWTWAIVGAAALADIVIEAGRASAGVTSFISTMNSQLANDNASTAILQISTDIGELNERISQVSTSQIKQSWSDLGNTMNSFGKDAEAAGQDWANSWGDLLNGNVVGSAEKLGKAIEGIFVPGQGAAIQAKNNIAAYGDEITQLLGKQATLFTETGKLVNQGYDYGQAVALMSLAGVKAGDSLQLMGQKVTNLIKGYEDMSVAGGLLSNSVDAVSFASEQQDSKVTELTQSWTTFIDLVTGGTSAFSTFETQMEGLSTAATTTASTLSVSAGKTSDVTKAAGQASSALKGTTVALDGTSSASLQLQQTWVGAIGDANSMMNALMEQASAAGLGAKGTQMLTQAGKDMVSQLLPMADGSAAATAQLYALAQQAGYQGPDSFSKLVSWVGKTSDAEQNLQSITGKLTVASANLTADVENLAQAVNSDLNQAMAAAILQANGGQQGFEQFAAAIHSGKLGVDALKGSAEKLAEELIATTGNTVTAHQEFDTFAIAMGLSKQKADQLWASVEKLADAMAHIPSHVSSVITITEDIEQGTTPITGINNSALPAAKASGGQVHGGSGRPGADDIPALLSDSEYVISAPAVKRYGTAMFDDLNAQRYAGGGAVGAGTIASSGHGEAAAGPTVHAEFHYHGTQQPGPEMRQAMMMDLTRAFLLG